MLINLSGTVDTNDNPVNVDKFVDMFINWIESEGWEAAVIFKKEKDE